MIEMKTKYLALLVSSALLLGACDEFLNENPSKTSELVPSTTEQLDYLINGISTAETNYNRILASDDFGVLTELQALSSTGYYPISSLWFALWNIDELKNANDYYFSEEYSRIYTANLVLDYLPNVSGTDADKARLNAEAHFIRAYSLFNLAETYCLPYADDTKSEMGLVLKKTIGYDESKTRATIEETYQMIEADLVEALKTTTTITTNDYGYLTTARANVAAVNGLAARFYLTTGDYAQALAYAQKALAAGGELTDYNTEMAYSDYSPYTITTKTGNKLKVYFPSFRNYSFNENSFLNKEYYYNRMEEVPNGCGLPSKALLAMYDQQYDLRYQYLYVENASYYYSGSDAFLYPTYYKYGQGARGWYIPSAPGVAEMILIKAEALARTNKVPEAMAAVNVLRAKRMDNTAGSSVINLTASTAQEAVLKILAERRRELPIISRWSDVRRLNFNAESFDDAGDLTRQFYSYTTAGVGSDAKTYTLAAKSRRFAQPIPELEIALTEGEMKQNTY